jgi:hypothetical protein
MTTVFENTMNKLFPTPPQVRCALVACHFEPRYQNIYFDYMPQSEQNDNIEITSNFRPNYKVMMEVGETPIFKTNKNIHNECQTVYLCCMQRDGLDTIYYLAYEQCNYSNTGGYERFMYSYTYNYIGAKLDEAILRFIEEPDMY